MAEPVCPTRCVACPEGRCPSCEKEEKCCVQSGIQVRCVVCNLAVDRVSHGHGYPQPHPAPAWLQTEADRYYVASGAKGAVGTCPGFSAFHISGWTCWVNGCRATRCGSFGHFDNRLSAAIFATVASRKKQGEQA